MTRPVGEINRARVREWPKISALGLAYDEGPRLKVASKPNRARGEVELSMWGDVTAFVDLDPEAARLLAQHLSAAADDAERRSWREDVYPPYEPERS